MVHFLLKLTAILCKQTKYAKNAPFGLQWSLNGTTHKKKLCTQNNFSDNPIIRSDIRYQFKIEFTISLVKAQGKVQVQPLVRYRGSLIVSIKDKFTDKRFVYV